MAKYYLSTFSSLFLIFFARSVFATTLFTCNPSQSDTTIYVSENENKINFKITNPKGYDFIDQYEGPISPDALSTIQDQFEELKVMHNEINIHWQKKKCQVDQDQFTIQCEGPADEIGYGLSVSTLSTTEISEKVKNNEFQKRKYRIIFEKNNKTFFVSLSFYKHHCFR